MQPSTFKPFTKKPSVFKVINSNSLLVVSMLNNAKFEVKRIFRVFKTRQIIRRQCIWNVCSNCSASFKMLKGIVDLYHALTFIRMENNANINSYRTPVYILKESIWNFHKPKRIRFRKSVESISKIWIIVTSSLLSTLRA